MLRPKRGSCTRTPLPHCEKIFIILDQCATGCLSIICAEILSGGFEKAVCLASAISQRQMLFPLFTFLHAISQADVPRRGWFVEAD